MPKLPHNFAMLRDAAREHVAEEVKDEMPMPGLETRVLNGRERMEALLSKRGAMPKAVEVDAQTNVGFCQAHRVGLADSACAGLEDVAITIGNNVWLLCLAHAQPIFKRDLR